MIQKRQDEYLLLYDPSTDVAQLLFGSKLLIAESPRPDCWIVKDGRHWFLFEHQRRNRNRFGSDLRGWLQHVRAMSGAATDPCSIAHRMLNAAQLPR